MAMTPEQGIRRRFYRAIRKIPRICFQWVELDTGESGFPDSVVSLPGVPGTCYIEVKFMYKGGSLSNWDEDQRIWTRKWSASNPVLILIGDAKSTYLLEASGLVDEPGFGPGDILGCWGPTIKHVELRACIKRILKEYIDDVDGV